MDTVYMELKEAGVLRFWQIEWQQEAGNVYVTYGRNGALWTCSHQQIQQHAESIQQYVVQAALEKLEEGYISVRQKKVQQQITHKSRQSAKSSQKRIAGILKRKQWKNNNYIRSELTLGECSSEESTISKKIRKISGKVMSLKGQAPPETGGPLGRLDDCVSLPSDRFQLYSQNGQLYDVLFKSRCSYYIVQILVDNEMDLNVKLYTRWGILGSAGRCQLTTCENLSYALKLFAAKFYKRTGRKWRNRENYIPKHGMYTWIQTIDTTILKEKYTVKNLQEKQTNGIYNSDNESRGQTRNTLESVIDGDNISDINSNKQAPQLSNLVTKMLVDSENGVDGNSGGKTLNTVYYQNQMVNDSEDIQCRSTYQNLIAQQIENIQNNNNNCQAMTYTRYIHQTVADSENMNQIKDT